MIDFTGERILESTPDEEASEMERLQSDPEGYGREMAEHFSHRFRETLRSWIRESGEDDQQIAQADCG